MKSYGHGHGHGSRVAGLRLAHPAREALSDGAGLLRRTRPGAAVDRARHGPHQPRVDRQALAGRGLLGAGLEMGRQSQVDAGGAALVAVDGCVRLERFDGRGRLMRAPPSVGGSVTTKSGSSPRSRTSTEPGASSRVISSMAAESTLSMVSRVADSRGAVSLSASSRASSPPASAATASSRRRESTYGVRSMASSWHHNGAKRNPLGGISESPINVTTLTCEDALVPG